MPLTGHFLPSYANLKTRTGLSGVVYVALVLGLSALSQTQDHTHGPEPSSSKGAQTPPPIVLIVPDKPAAVPNANGMYREGDTQITAAERLAKLIALSTGSPPPPIVAASKAQSAGIRIFVGYGPHLQGRAAPPSEPEAFEISESNGDLLVLGEIAPAGENFVPVPMDRGLMHAVETLAEEVMGFRFVFSVADFFVEKDRDGKPLPESAVKARADLFRLGTAIPEPRPFEVPGNLRIASAPAFSHRTHGSDPRNLMGLRSGSGPAFHANHSYDVNWWSRAFGATFPGAFVPPGGAQQSGAEQAITAERRKIFLDYTDPLVLEERIRQIGKLRAKEKAGGFHYTPTEKYIIEEPNDIAAPSLEYNERARALWNPKHGQWGAFSNIWFDYMRRLSAETSRIWPGTRISTLAYMNHYAVPDFPLPDNIDVMLTIMRTSMGNKQQDVFERNLEDVRKWSEHLGGDRKRLFLWEYGCWPTFWVNAPIICPRPMQRWLQAVRPHVSGAFIELYGPPEYTFLMRRLWLRLLWNPDLDVTSEVEDVCTRFFGPSGATMNEFYSRLIERYETPWKDPVRVWDQYMVSPQLYYGQSYPAEEIARLANLLETARRKAGLPAAYRAKAIESGSAIHVCNIADKTVPVRFAITAGEKPLVRPSVGWKGGRMTWYGTLRPNETLEISGGKGEIFNGDVNPKRIKAPAGKADGKQPSDVKQSAVREVDLVLEGKIPNLAAGAVGLAYFWQHNPGARFDATAVYEPSDEGPAAPPRNGETPAKAADPSIFAKRLDWLADAMMVLRPTEAFYGPKRGFFAEATHFHGVPEKEPSLRLARMDSLPGLSDPRWKKVQEQQLVSGKEGGNTHWLIRGFPADLRTRLQAVEVPEGIALRLVADAASPPPGTGKQPPADTFTIRVGMRPYTVTIGSLPHESSILNSFEADARQWRALVLLKWSELSPGVERRPDALLVQILRHCGDSHSLWSPPIGLWTDIRGPGSFVLPE